MTVFVYLKTCTIFAKFYESLGDLSCTTILHWNVDKPVWLWVKLFTAVKLSSIVQQIHIFFNKIQFLKFFCHLTLLTIQNQLKIIGH